jgi:hydroxymethylbilane synthase
MDRAGPRAVRAGAQDVIRLGTRASALALAQAGAVADRLRELGAAIEIVPMRTEGDRLAEKRLADVGGKGLFVKDLEDALLRREIDVVVHSLKDLPADVPPGLVIAAYPEREDARDVLVTRAGGRLLDLRAGASVGTSSPRRRAFALSIRPDLVIEPIRGNVETRLRKLADGQVDGVILAAAGLRRLGLAPGHAEVLSPDLFVPAVGQGILGIEARNDDRPTLAVLEGLDDRVTRACALAERAYLRRLGASCVTPMAAHATVDGTRLRLDGVVLSDDGRRVVRDACAGAMETAEAIGRELAETLLSRGAERITALHPVGR